MHFRRIFFCACLNSATFENYLHIVSKASSLTLERNNPMKRFLSLSVSAVALVAFGFVFGAAMVAATAQDAPVNSIPVFPAEKAERAPVQPPVHATHKTTSNGKTFRFVTCRESRDVRGNQELRCLSWNAKKGWSKSPKWVPAYQLTAAR